VIQELTFKSSTLSEPVPRTVLEDLPYCLARAVSGFRRFNEQNLQAIGLESLAPGLASVLHALKELNFCTIDRLVRTTQIPNGTLTGLLNVLERDGFVRRIRNPADGRSRLVGLTADGHQICTQLQRRHRIVMEFVHEVLSKREEVELARLLNKLIWSMRANAAIASRPKPSPGKKRTGARKRNSAERSARIRNVQTPRQF